MRARFSNASPIWKHVLTRIDNAGSTPDAVSCPSMALSSNLARPSGWRTNKRTCHMAWTLLSIAGILEIGFAFGMKWSAGFTRLIPGLFTARHRLVEYLSSVTLAPHLASRDWLRGLDRYRRGRHRGSGDGGAGRFRCATADVLHWSHFGRRDRTQAGLGKLSMVAPRQRGVRASWARRPQEPH